MRYLVTLADGQTRIHEADDVAGGERHLKLIKDGRVIATYRNHGFDMIEPLSDDDAPATETLPSPSEQDSSS